MPQFSGNKMSWHERRGKLFFFYCNFIINEENYLKKKFNFRRANVRKELDSV